MAKTGGTGMSISTKGTNLPDRIVFCIDCKHRGYKDFNCYCESGPVTGIVKPWYYCWYGELRDELKKVVNK